MENTPPAASKCHDCNAEMRVLVRACTACKLQIQAELPYPRLARLDAEQRRLIEDFLLTAGNLSQLARDYGVSRPTMRQRVDAVISTVQALREADMAQCETLLEEVEKGHLAPEMAARTLRELQA